MVEFGNSGVGEEFLHKIIERKTFKMSQKPISQTSCETFIKAGTCIFSQSD